MRYYTFPSEHSGAIGAVGDRDEALGYWIDAGVMRQPDAPVPMTVAVWSGTVTDELFAADIRNWSVAARAGLHDKLDRQLAAATEKGVTSRLLLRPHARHILNDWHTCVRFVTQRRTAGDERVALLVDPAAMLTAQMLPRAAEHLERAFEQVGLLLRGEVGSADMIGGVVLSNLRGAREADPMGYDEGEVLWACELDDAAGVLDARVIVKLARTHLVAGTPVVFVGGRGGGERQRAVVERA